MSARLPGLLSDYRIKRVPVVRGGRIVGLVSRADLVRVLAEQQTAPIASPKGGLIGEARARLDEHFLHSRPESWLPAEPTVKTDKAVPTADDLQDLMTDFEGKGRRHRLETRDAAVERRRHRVAELIDRHVSEGDWWSMLHQSREAAEHGQKESLLLRFPSQLCSDGGRAINVSEPGRRRLTLFFQRGL